MLIYFSVKNFTSVKGLPDGFKFLSMFAVDNYTQKSDNTFFLKNLTNTNNVFFATDISKIPVLKSAGIFGANVSGKSSILKAFELLISCVVTGEIPSHQKLKFLGIGDLDANIPIRFELYFVINDTYFEYEVAFASDHIYSEQLLSFCQDRITYWFSRPEDCTDFETYLSNKQVKRQNDLNNTLYLSLLATEGLESEPMLKICEYLKGYVFFQSSLNNTRYFLETTVAKILQNDVILKFKLDKWLKILDTGIDRITFYEKEDRYALFAVHKVFRDNVVEGEVEFPFFEAESPGTAKLYCLGALMLSTLKYGQVLVVDDLNNHLHPNVCKFLIKIFHQPKMNPNNAQLIFTASATELLDHTIFQKDQIWFTEKDKHGGTQFFSLQDFDGVPDDAPFDRWYLQGKFGALSNIKEVEFIYGDE
jgi:AAA15 family ATPase/GTPase